jgi:hypothetical protein
MGGGKGLHALRNNRAGQVPQVITVESFHHKLVSPPKSGIMK